MTWMLLLLCSVCLNSSPLAPAILRGEVSGTRLLTTAVQTQSSEPARDEDEAGSLHIHVPAIEIEAPFQVYLRRNHELSITWLVDCTSGPERTIEVGDLHELGLRPGDLIWIGVRGPGCLEDEQALRVASYDARIELSLQGFELIRIPVLDHFNSPSYRALYLQTEDELVSVTRREVLFSTAPILPLLRQDEGFSGLVRTRTRPIGSHLGHFFTITFPVVTEYGPATSRLRDWIPAGRLAILNLHDRGSNETNPLVPVDRISWTNSIGEEGRHRTMQALAEDLQGRQLISWSCGGDADEGLERIKETPLTWYSLDILESFLVSEFSPDHHLRWCHRPGNLLKTWQDGRLDLTCTSESRSGLIAIEVSAELAARGGHLNRISLGSWTHGTRIEIPEGPCTWKLPIDVCVPSFLQIRTKDGLASEIRSGAIPGAWSPQLGPTCSLSLDFQDVLLQLPDVEDLVCLLEGEAVAGLSLEGHAMQGSATIPGLMPGKPFARSTEGFDSAALLVPLDETKCVSLSGLDEGQLRVSIAWRHSGGWLELGENVLVEEPLTRVRLREPERCWRRLRVENKSERRVSLVLDPAETGPTSGLDEFGAPSSRRLRYLHVPSGQSIDTWTLSDIITELAADWRRLRRQEIRDGDPSVELLGADPRCYLPSDGAGRLRAAAGRDLTLFLRRPALEGAAEYPLRNFGPPFLEDHFDTARALEKGWAFFLDGEETEVILYATTRHSVNGFPVIGSPDMNHRLIELFRFEPRRYRRGESEDILRRIESALKKVDWDRVDEVEVFKVEESEWQRRR